MPPTVLACRDDSINISIEVDGEVLPIYQLKHSREGELLKSEGWICSEAGKVRRDGPPV